VSLEPLTALAHTRVANQQNLEDVVAAHRKSERAKRAKEKKKRFFQDDLVFSRFRVCWAGRLRCAVGVDWSFAVLVVFHCANENAREKSAVRNLVHVPAIRFSHSQRISLSSSRTKTKQNKSNFSGFRFSFDLFEKAFFVRFKNAHSENLVDLLVDLCLL
jgi:hypothetical protein